MATRSKRDGHVSFETQDLVGWLHDAANLIRNLDSCTHLLGSADTDISVRKEVYRSATQSISMLKEMFPNLSAPMRSRKLCTECDLNEVAIACVDMLRSQARSVGVTLEISGLAKQCLVKGDRATYRRAIYNLILNGLEATAPEGRVAVSTSRDRDTVALTVSDSGIGMLHSTRRQLFKRPVSTKVNGSGHGLMRMAATIAANGGTIKVNSATGKGTTITLEFPATRRPGWDPLSNTRPPRQRRNTGVNVV